MTDYRAMDIARWLLAWADEDDADLSNLKLQKLLYYAQGHYLGQTGESLFDEEIQAWAHGPVVPAVYRSFKAYGAGPIDTDEALGDSFCWDDYRDVEDHLIAVWNTYGHFAAWALRNRTHRESPWLETFDEDDRGSVISKERMRKFFCAT